MEFTISIAKTSIAVILEESLEQIGADLRKLYTGFLSNHRKTDACIRISCDNLTAYCESKNGPIRLPKKGNPIQNHGFSVASVYKSLFLCISLILVEQKKLLIHGAGIKKKDSGYLFLGESGAGKTTIASSAKRDDLFSDDSPVIGRENNSFYIYPSPYSQVDMFEPKRNDHYLKKTKLTKLFFLKKNDKLFIKPRDRRSAFAEIIKKHIHSFEFMGSKSRIAVFNLCYDLCDSIPIYDLHFQKNDKFRDII